MWNPLTEMIFFAFGYVGAAAGFYYLIAKTAKLEPEFNVVAEQMPTTATVIDIARLYEKKVA